MGISKADYAAILARLRANAEPAPAPAKAQTVKAKGNSAAKRAAAGHKAKESGDDFQDALDAYHGLLMRQGRMARVFRMYPPMRSMWRHGELVFKATDKGQCDYGFVTPAGVFGLFDAKSTSHAKQFTWASGQEHQIDELRALHDATAGVSPAFALVNWREHREVRLHPVWTIEGRTVYREDGTPLAGYDWPVVVGELWG